ncbi:MAG TPA: NYN domain-containing protein [Candidatus Thermoplasmatota archaeon]|nr:NYN domain-containing protein [Candidatus Thermoplasmatota archaeon]
MALFVDSANMHHACKRAGYFIDWRKAREHFTQGASFGGAFFYYAVPPTIEVERQRFLDFLSYNGFIVRTKTLKTVYDSQTGEAFQKANLSIEIALDMVQTSDHWDTAYLFSGDGDFDRVVEVLRARGKRIHVVTAQGMLARELAYAVDKPVLWLEELEKHIGRTDRRPEKFEPVAAEERLEPA